ncbi:hypothetical protein FACS1894137_18740 [Spirochaetia bacterium]|nr:hypothetical protein FACS1894137_18740 [Spirochaetia bacterium]
MILPQDYKQPALLLGNGINNYNDTGKSFKNILKEMALSVGINEHKCDAILESTGDITYPEFYDALKLRYKTGENVSSGDDYTSFKESLQKELRKWQSSLAHENTVNFARNNCIPLLTTNYDSTLLTDSVRSHYPLRRQRNSAGDIQPSKTLSKKSTQFYPIYSYYSDHEIQNVLKDFGIWHIHGCVYYRNSIRLGIGEYFRFIKWIDLRLSDKHMVHKNESWNDNNSWLDIFLHNDLIIMGLALESQEIDLRRLLKARYFYGKNLNLKTQYVVNSDTGKDGKRFDVWDY